jgi:hypothetical protein
MLLLVEVVIKPSLTARIRQIRESTLEFGGTTRNLGARSQLFKTLNYRLANDSASNGSETVGSETRITDYSSAMASRNAAP